jgi:hypothetical protein
MTDVPKRAPPRQRPELTDPPFLCSDCRHGRMIVQKLQPWLLSKESWQDDSPTWFWQARCGSPKVTPWKFAVFCHPVVECDAFRPRKLLTTEDLAHKVARKAKRARKRRRRKDKKKRSGRK